MGFSDIFFLDSRRVLHPAPGTSGCKTQLKSRLWWRTILNNLNRADVMLCDLLACTARRGPLRRLMFAPWARVALGRTGLLKCRARVRSGQRTPCQSLTAGSGPSLSHCSGLRACTACLQQHRRACTADWARCSLRSRACRTWCTMVC